MVFDHQSLSRMAAGRKMQTHTPPSHMSGNLPVSARNLRKIDLGGVMFACKNSTIAECLRKQLFGLPSMDFTYVKHIEPGLPLFLFNYSDHKLHGIYEAASHGQMNIDSYAWTDNGAERTQFPAQVRIRIRKQCSPLMESQFRNAIGDNYYNPQHFWFELDHAQTRCLTALFTSLPGKPTYISIGPSLPAQITKSFEESSCSDLSKAVSSTPSEVAWNQECIDPDIWETKKSLELSVDDKSTWVHLDDRDIQNSRSCKASSNFLVDMKQKEKVLDWEELIGDNDEASYSGANPCWDGGDQILHGEKSGNVELNADVEKTLLRLQMLSVNRPKGCLKDSVIPSRTEGTHENGAHSANEPDLTEKKEPSASDLDLGNTEVQAIAELTKLKDRIAALEKQKVESRRKVKQLRDQLRDHLDEHKSKDDLSVAFDDSLNKFVENFLGSENGIYLVGGFDGSCWLSTLGCFSPSLDIVASLESMSCARSYASAVVLDSNLYVCGGGANSHSWYDSVERYNPRYDEWTACPSMINKKGSLAGATLNGKIFAIGGGNEIECFSDVEMFDPALGRWIHSQAMLQKRFAPGAAVLDGVLYVVGGYDGKDYLSSAERFDPREAYWNKISCMKVRRGTSSMVAFNEKLYAIGGYDGEKNVSSVEIFDPRLGYWVMGEPMNFVRGYAAAVVLGDTLFAIGGIKDEKNILETVECYKEGGQWADSGLRAVGRRSFCSAVIL